MAELSLRGVNTQGAIRDEDGDFEPSADMLVHDFDDEQTLEEEEMLEGETNFSNEIDDLTREGEMPIHELLKMYGYGGGGSTEEEEGNEEQDLSENEQSSTVQDKTKDNKDRESCDQEKDGCSSSDESTHCRRSHGTAQLISLESCSYFDGNFADESEDEDYVPSEDWKKEVKVGPMYQAETPAGLCKYEDNEKVYENDDQLLWNPELLAENEVEEYLAEASKRTGEDVGVQASPEKSLIKDNEQALFELVKCNFNKEEALSKLKFEIKPAKEKLSYLTEEEQRDFEKDDEACGNVNTEECIKQIKLWRRTSSLHPGIMDSTGRMSSEMGSTDVATFTESSNCSSSQLEQETSIAAHQDEDSTEKLHVCVDHMGSHTNGSSDGSHFPTPETKFHSSSRPDTSSVSREAVNRLVRQREEEEGSENPLKRPKTEVDVLMAATVSSCRMETV